MKTLVAIPCMDMVQTDFVRCLIGMRIEGQVQFSFSKSSLIYDARDKLADVAIDGGFDAVLWLDSDMVFPPTLWQRLSARLEEGREIVTGIYFTRTPPVRPVLYKELRIDREGDFLKPYAEHFDDYPEDGVFQVAGCGFGAVMMSTALLRRIRDTCGLPFLPAAGLGEDLAFCMRARELGAEIWCDAGVKLGHVGQVVYDEETYRACRAIEAKEAQK